MTASLNWYVLHIRTPLIFATLANLTAFKLYNKGGGDMKEYQRGFLAGQSDRKLSKGFFCHQIYFGTPYYDGYKNGFYSF